MIILILLCVIFISPLVIDQIMGIVSTLGHKLSYLQELFSSTPVKTIVADQTWIPEVIRSNLVESLKNSSGELNNIIQTGVAKMITGLTSSIGIFSNIALQTFNIISGFLIKLMMLTFLSVLFSVEKDMITNFIVALFPENKQKRMHLQIQRMYKYLAFWFKFRLALSIFMFTGIYLCF